MSKFTKRYKEHILRYGMAFIQDIFANPTHGQDVDYMKLKDAELHTMMGYDKKNRIFVIYSADNDDHEWFVFTRERPMHALEAAGQTEAPGYYDVDHRCIMKYEDVSEDVRAVCKHMHKECEAD